MELEKIVVAVDSFKGSLSSMEAGNIVAGVCRKMLPSAHIDVFPLADGGEGTVEALTDGLEGEIVTAVVTGPLQKPIKSRYGLLAKSHTAVLEMADAAGLTLVPKAQRNPLYTTTYGLGELILQALSDGCRNFIIGIGGSATNDCGLGMLSALGWRFFKADGSLAGVCGKDLADIALIDGSRADSRLKECHFSIACDVKNPLCGPKGCSAVFGPQKGAAPDTVVFMDKAIDRFADLAEHTQKKCGKGIPGAGAAGGLGFAFYAFLGGELVPGAELCLETIGIKKALKGVDLLITGEGRIDSQTAMGKGPASLAALAHQLSRNVCTVAVCGCALPDAEIVNAHGIDAYFPILHLPMSVDEAMQKQVSGENLRQTVTQIIRLLQRR